MLAHGHMSQWQDVVCAIEVSPKAVSKIRAHDYELALRNKNSSCGGHEVLDLLGRPEMLQHVGSKDHVEMTVRELSILESILDEMHLISEIVGSHHVDGPPFRGGNGVDELASTARAVHDYLG